LLSEVEGKMVADLYRLKALTYGQIGELYAGDCGDKAVYRLVEGLENKGLIRVRVAEWDKRLRYVVLTADGYVLAADLNGAEAAEGYKTPKRGEAYRAVLANEFFVKAVAAGFPRERLAARKEALAFLGLQPNEASCLMWMASTKAGRWGVHIPWKKRPRQAIERGIMATPASAIQFHVIVYDNSVRFGRDRIRYAAGAPSMGLHLFTLDMVQKWAAWAAKEMTPEEDLGGLLRAAYPGAVILPPPADSPGVCLVRRQRDALVVDMRFNRVGALNAVLRAVRSGLDRKGWGAGILLIFSDVKQLKMWSAKLGNWAWALVEDQPGAIYRVTDGRPVLLRQGGHFHRLSAAGQ